MKLTILPQNKKYLVRLLGMSEEWFDRSIALYEETPNSAVSQLTNMIEEYGVKLVDSLSPEQHAQFKQIFEMATYLGFVLCLSKDNSQINELAERAMKVYDEGKAKAKQSILKGH